MQPFSPVRGLAFSSLSPQATASKAAAPSAATGASRCPIVRLMSALLCRESGGRCTEEPPTAAVVLEDETLRRVRLPGRRTRTDEHPVPVFEAVRRPVD